MPIIFFSSNLAPLVGKNRLINIKDISKPDPAISWNARLFFINGRKNILFTNKATLYSVVRLNVLKKDFTDVTGLFLGSLLAQLKHDNLYTQVQENYWLQNISDFVFAKTDNDKRVIGSMNDFIAQIKIGISLGSTLLKSINDISVANYVNTIPMSLIHYNTPLNSFRQLQADIVKL
jgi:hypothetical protein